MSNIQTVWVDVSLLWHWRGSFTGIQRVLYSYLKYLEEDPSVILRLFVFSGDFEEVTYEALRSQINQPPIESGVRIPIVRRLRSLPGAVIAHGMPLVKTSVRRIPYVGELAARGYVSTRSLYRKARSSASQHSRTGNVLFSKEDTVLLIDGNWSESNIFAQTLVRHKHSVGFTLVHLVHDMVAVNNPAYVARMATKVIGGYFDIILPELDTLLTISQSTLRDVVSYCKEGRIPLTDHRAVIRLGDTIESTAHGATKVSARKPLGLQSSHYILTVGTLEVRKNHHLLYYVYKLAAERGIDLPNLVIVGRRGWMSDETLDLIKKDTQVRQKVQVLHAVTDAELLWLYANCQLTVFPSFYEGWGLPVVESLAHGKICVASNASSIPEAGGTLAIYASPFSPAEFLDKLLDCLVPETKAQLERDIVKGYQEFTWAQSYESLKQRIVS